MLWLTENNEKHVWNNARLLGELDGFEGNESPEGGYFVRLSEVEDLIERMRDDYEGRICQGSQSE